MFEWLTIQNFQTHQKFRVDFDPGITTIVGPSDVGKSAIIRALRWVCTNTPGGTAFVRHGAKGATVSLCVGGHVVKRRRSPDNTTNEYYLDDAKYKAFGRAVPEPIDALINMGGTGWQNQHDAPYWFSETPGEVSRQLNAIVDLGIIDETMAAVAKAVHRTRTKMEVAEENLTTTKKEYDDLAWVPKFEEAVGVLEAKEHAYTNAAACVVVVGRLVEEVRGYQSTHERAAVAAQRGETMVHAGIRATTAQNNYTRLAELVVKVNQLSDAVEPVPCTKAMERARMAYNRVAGDVTALQNLIDDIHNKEAALCQAEKQLRTAKKMIPTQCPTCGQSL